jgi:hypothetical protein
LASPGGRLLACSSYHPRMVSRSRSL